jgi:DNA mismatch repair protein MutS2
MEREAEATLDALEAAASVEETPPPPPPRYRGALQPGDQVWVEPYQALGEVIKAQRGEVEVQLGRFRASLKRSQVELRERAAQLEARPPEGEAEAGGVHMPVVESPGFELDLRGETVEEALPRLDRYLEDAYLTGLPWVRIIHGKGTGALRAAVRDVLRKHELVAAYETGKDGEGGDGVTVAKLAVE